MCPLFRQGGNLLSPQTAPHSGSQKQVSMVTGPSGQVLFLLFPGEKVPKPPKEGKREMCLIEIQNPKQQRQEANGDVRKRTKAKESGQTPARTPYGLDRSAFYFKC